MKITAQKIKPFVYALLGLAMAGIFYYSFSFLHEYFYRAMAQSEEIYILRQGVGLEDININQYNQAVEKLKQKNETGQKPPEIKNPF